MRFDEEGKKAEKAANVGLLKTGQEKREANDWNSRSFLAFSLLYLTAKKSFKYALKCWNLKISHAVGDCELACCVVDAGSISSEHPGFPLVKF